MNVYENIFMPSFVFLRRISSRMEFHKQLFPDRPVRSVLLIHIGITTPANQNGLIRPT